MFANVLLGLLSDGTARHGYELVVLYRTRSGLKVSPGNVYRELARLAARGLVQTVARSPDVDARRIPYRITDRGRSEFMTWLTTSPADGQIWDWLLFADQLPPEIRSRLLQRRREDVEYSIRLIGRRRDDLRSVGAQYDPSLISVTRDLGLALLERDALEQVAAFFEQQQGAGGGSTASKRARLAVESRADGRALNRSRTFHRRSTPRHTRT
jgi:DNA-binding PadR family transcriptional regulator